jgi:hypothetical protein
MLMKTGELIGPALDWAVAKCEGIDLFETEGWVYPEDGGRAPYKPSTDWSHGGPIIERKSIELGTQYHIEMAVTLTRAVMHTGANSLYQLGPTPLIAAMRCYVASKLGDNVDVPEELVP